MDENSINYLAASIKTSGYLDGEQLKVLEALMQEVGLNPHNQLDTNAFIDAIKQEIQRLNVGERLNLRHVARMATFLRAKEKAQKGSKPQTPYEMAKEGYRQHYEEGE